MYKPTPMSVTTTPCSCGYLSPTPGDASHPLHFDKALEEYYFEHYLENGARVTSIIYHCPMCGGCAPKSKRNSISHSISDSELQRMEALIANIETVGDIEKILGRPDSDVTVDQREFGVQVSGTGVREDAKVRVLTYLRLSEVAELKFVIYPNGRLEQVLAPKFLEHN